MAGAVDDNTINIVVIIIIIIIFNQGGSKNYKRKLRNLFGNEPTLAGRHHLLSFPSKPFSVPIPLIQLFQLRDQ